jgi:hypothetical protein
MAQPGAAPPCEASAPPIHSGAACAANVSKSSAFSFPAIGRPAKNQIPLLDSTRWKPARASKTCRKSKDFQPLTQLLLTDDDVVLAQIEDGGIVQNIHIGGRAFAPCRARSRVPKIFDSACRTPFNMLLPLKDLGDGETERPGVRPPPSLDPAAC